MEASDRPVRVLVVEDDQEIAQVLQRALRLEGYEVRLAGDGVAALDDVHAFLPDIIVLDLGLPRLDGIEVARRLRKDDDDTPILMLTARDLDPVEPRQAEVEHDQVGEERVHVVECGHAVAGQPHLVAFQAQRALQNLGDLLVVLHHEDAHGPV